MKRIIMITALCFAALLSSCGQQLQTSEKSQMPEVSGHLLQSSSDDVTVESAEFMLAEPTCSAAQPEEIAVRVTSLVWNKSSDLTLYVGDSNRRTAATTPTGGAVTYTSSDTSVAAVDATGNVICKAAGKTVITATSGDASVSYNLTVAAASASSDSSSSATVSSGASSPTNGSGVFAGYTVTVTDTTTIATTSYGDASFSFFYFYSASGKALGSISGSDMLKILQKHQANGTAPYESTEYAVWFAEQFNLYRGLSGSFTGTEKSTAAISSNFDAVTEARKVVRFINNERSKVGVPELSIDEGMMEYAQQRAEEIVTNFEHEYGEYGENLNRGAESASKVVASWMASSGHKENLLLEKWNYTGLGCYQAENGKIHWVQIFS